MSVLPIDLRPTFPLDEDRIQRMKRDLIWRSPRLIVGQALGRIAASLKAAGINAETSLVNRCLDWWSDLEQELTAKVIRQLVTESNLEQDDSIRTMIRHLEQVGRTQYAISLGRVLLLKQHIEHGLHHDGELTDRKAEIERLVDSICQEVCNELFTYRRFPFSVGKHSDLTRPRKTRPGLQTAQSTTYADHARLHYAFRNRQPIGSQSGTGPCQRNTGTGERSLGPSD